MSFARAVYTALTYLALPVALARLAWRSRREPGYSAHVSERLGVYRVQTPARPLIWIHAVSVGETRAAEPLVLALRARYPDYAILMTHMTPTGRRTGVALFGDTVLRAYLPYDFPGAVARFLDHFRPRFGVIMETEIWPNLVAACKTRGVPIVLANARLSERSARGYLRLGSLARDAVGAFPAIAAQTSADARRFDALGAGTVTVTGSLKFDVTPPLEQLARGRAWRESYGPRPVLLAASTRDGEEALVLDAFAELSGNPLLVLVPRHPQRFDAVAALLGARGLRHARRSGAAEVTAETQVLLGDSMGEMAAYYAACDLAFVGGSLLPFGGQNFIEACAAGTPVLLGPHTYNFAESAEQAIAAGAAVRIDSPQALARVATRLLGDHDARARMAQRALAFAHAHQGATARLMEMIEEVAKRRATAIDQ
jgi:3-deoxy-D-manno-octulosonic-acid transferase